MTRSEFRRKVKESRLTVLSDKQGVKVTAEVTKEVTSNKDVPVVEEAAESNTSKLDVIATDKVAEVGSIVKEDTTNDSK